MTADPKRTPDDEGRAAGHALGAPSLGVEQLRRVRDIDLELIQRIAGGSGCRELLDKDTFPDSFRDTAIRDGFPDGFQEVSDRDSFPDGFPALAPDTGPASVAPGRHLT